MAQTPRILKRSIATLSLAALAVSLGMPQVYGAGGDWTATGTTGSWGTTTNWVLGAVPGTTAGDVVNVASNIAAAAAITLDGARTVGTLVLGDADGSVGFTLSAGTSGSLVLDQTASGTALVRFGAAAASTLSAANTISAPITLNDNARFYTTLTGTQTLSELVKIT